MFKILKLCYDFQIMKNQFGEIPIGGCFGNVPIGG